MSTRRAAPDAPFSQERYMSSPEYDELNAINGMAVAKRTALLVSQNKKELLWFIQGLSTQPGGLTNLVRGLVEMFPKRCGPHSMVFAPVPSPDGQTLYNPERRLPLREFLIQLCVNPGLRISLPDDDADILELEDSRLEDEYREHCPDQYDARVDCFVMIVDSLMQYKRRYEESARVAFCQTAISKKIWKQLDTALQTRTMVLIDGLEGRGKTEAVSAWCRAHLGVARFVSLKGTSTKTSQFRELARALGIGHSHSRKAAEMQGRVEEVLSVSGLMPVIDEAHFFFSQGPRIYTRPEMLDWIDTALCNPPSPVALITTPQFLQCMARAGAQAGWNYKQFQRRCKRYEQLPRKNSARDIEAVARHLLPNADNATIKAVMAYEALSAQDLSAVGDVVREARTIASEENSKKVTFQHVSRAVNEVLMPSAIPWREMEVQMQALREKGARKRQRQQPLPVSAAPLEEMAEAPAVRERNIAPTTAEGGRNRISDPDVALVKII